MELKIKKTTLETTKEFASKTRIGSRILNLDQLRITCTQRRNGVILSRQTDREMYLYSRQTDRWRDDRR